MRSWNLTMTCGAPRSPDAHQARQGACYPQKKGYIPSYQKRVCARNIGDHHDDPPNHPCCGFRVVATLAKKHEDAVPVRVVAVLAPDQTLTLSTPREWGTPAEAVYFVRRADTVLVH